MSVGTRRNRGYSDIGVTVRTYRGGDESGVVSVWNRALTFDPIDMERFVRQVLCDVNFCPEGLQIACNGDEIVGFALAIERRLPLSGSDLEPETGWITAFGVDPTWQGRGVGGALLESAEEFLRGRGKRRVDVSPYAPNYFWPGVDAEAYDRAFSVLEGRGYQPRYVAAAMDRNLVGFHIPGDVIDVERERIDEGYTFGRLDPPSLYEVSAFAEADFSPDWGRSVREAVAQGVPWDHILYVRNPERGVVGFAMYGAYGGTLERFGPFGVAGSERGKGLGKILLYRTMEAMSARGLHGAWFLWTGEETAAGALYLRAGFQVTRRFHVLQKSL